MQIMTFFSNNYEDMVYFLTQSIRPTTGIAQAPPGNHSRKLQLKSIYSPKVKVFSEHRLVDPNLISSDFN